MSEDSELTPEERGKPHRLIEPDTLAERHKNTDFLKPMKKLKQEQRARANMLDLNAVKEEHQTYQAELVKLGIILAACLGLFSWLTGWH
ncbi:MAG: hypothetical protein KKB51_01150 [Candidatus Riflebacteria bacterium]|nr:hypothetical protein [Candidatus Riflebacteria bacterium]